MRREIPFMIFKYVVMVFIASVITSGMPLAENTGEQTVEKAININEATVKELAALPGIGKKKAEAIVAYRNENGQFNSIDDLKKVEGIGKKTLEKIKEQITF